MERGIEDFEKQCYEKINVTLRNNEAQEDQDDSIICDVCRSVSFFVYFFVSYLFMLLSAVCLHNFVYLFCSLINKKITKWYSVTSATFAFTKLVMALLVFLTEIGKKICYFEKKIREMNISKICLHLF